MTTRRACVYLKTGQQVEFKLTAPMTTSESPQGDSFRTIQEARLPAGLSKTQKAEVARYITREWGTHCQHSYDCCGHWYLWCYATVHARKLVVRTHHTRNV